MMDQSVVDELIAQRDRILFGKWVSHAPRRDGEACTVFWFASSTEESPCLVRGLSSSAIQVLEKAFWQQGMEVYSLDDAIRWNDRQATRQEVLDVLDKAIRLAKESA